MYQIFKGRNNKWDEAAAAFVLFLLLDRSNISSTQKGRENAISEKTRETATILKMVML